MYPTSESVSFRNVNPQRYMYCLVLRNVFLSKYTHYRIILSCGLQEATGRPHLHIVAVPCTSVVGSRNTVHSILILLKIVEFHFKASFN